MTAVEWFAGEIKGGKLITNQKFEELLQQAKEMEKQQELKKWIETWSLGYDSGFDNCKKIYETNQQEQ